MYALLANLHRSLDRLQLPYAEFFKQTPLATAQPESTAVDGEAENLIRAAYEALSTEPGQWIGLADLREQLADFDRDTVDTALRSMARQPDVRIIPVANVKSLTDRDRVAALRIGLEDNHALAIGAA
jgi:hypothetical protein